MNPQKSVKPNNKTHKNSKKLSRFCSFQQHLVTAQGGLILKFQSPYRTNKTWDLLAFTTPNSCMPHLE